MEILKSFTKNKATIELIELDEKHYCVRKVTKRFLLGQSIEFFVVDRMGLSMTYPGGLSHDSTVADKERCELIFSANLAVMGAIE